MKKQLGMAVGLLTAFLLWTLLVCFTDVQSIGPQHSAVGLATLNNAVHSLTGVHFTLYHITDWLGLVPIAVCMGFGVLGLLQWISRKHLFKVDRNLLILGGYYLVVIAVYLLFENVIINYRPVLIEGILEISYPSSTTLLVLCVMPTAALELSRRIRHAVCKTITVHLIMVFTLFMVIGRLVSGVHWFSDIIGGLLLSAGLVMLYRACTEHHSS